MNTDAAQLEARVRALEAALREGAKRAEALKQECGDDPESPRAIQNGRCMSLAYFLSGAIMPRRTWHDLKTDPDAFDAVAADLKTHEIRYDDRDFKVGDGLRLRKTRYTGAQMRLEGKPLEYVGEPLERTVSHIQRGYGLDPGWVILSLVA